VLGTTLDDLMGDASDDETASGPVVDAVSLGAGSLGAGSLGAGIVDDHTPGSWPRVDEPLQPAEGRKRVEMSGVVWERLTHDHDPYVDFLHVEYAPGSSSCTPDQMMRHGGREYGHLLSGRLDVQVGFETYELGRGDSIHFDSMTPHRLSNPYDEPCRAVWFVLARQEDDRMSGVE
jgi:quercetin dioxygenase-like cupin family protein